MQPSRDGRAAAGRVAPLLSLCLVLVGAAAGPAAAQDGPDEGPVEPQREGAPHEAFELLGSPNHLPVRDIMRGGTGASLAVSWLGDLEQSPDYVLRLAVGLQLGLLDDRLRIGLLFPIDLAHQDFDDNSESTDDLPPHYLRGGGSDVRASVGFMVVDERDLGVLVDVAVWIPSGSQPHGIDHTRIVPSLELQSVMGERLIFRGRAGGLLDFDDEGEQLGTLALGLDYVLIGSWTLGLTVDGFGGRSGDVRSLGRDGEGVFGAAAGIGSSVALLDWLRLESGVRVGVTDDYVDRLGRFQVVLGLRAVDNR